MGKSEEENDWIYHEYKDKVHGYIRGRTHHAQDAEDLTANVFLKVYQNYHLFDEERASLSTWIYTITQHTLYDYYRTNRTGDEWTEMMAAAEDIESGLLREESLEELADALEQLEEKERDLILFHYYKNMTLKDIAQRMGVSYATAKNLHRRALDKLKCLLR